MGSHGEMITALGYITFAVAFGVAVGYRQAQAALRHIAAVKRRIDADIEFMKVIPADMDWKVEQ